MQRGTSWFRALSSSFVFIGIMQCYPAISAEESNPLLSGIYTVEQANRGQMAYSENCASCHANDLRGNSNSPGLIGLSFLFLWEGRPLGELFEKMRTEMPTDRPGALSLDTYLDLTAFLLQANEYPSSSSPLTAELIESGISIVSPPQ